MPSIALINKEILACRELYLNGNTDTNLALFGRLCYEVEWDSFILDGEGVFRDVTGQKVPRNKIRKIMYKHYTFLAHGHLGKGYRVKIPDCVLAGIREKCPDENGSYMGFKEK